MLNDALKYVRQGIAVFPLSEGSKIPLKGTSGVKEATKSESQVRSWWASGGKYNIGVALGRVSGVVAIDLDRNHGATDDDLKRFPRTVTVKSRNGYHLYFKYRDGLKNKIVLPGDDGQSAAYLRSDGYYVVGVGSVVGSEAGDWEYVWHADAGGELSLGECPLAEFSMVGEVGEVAGGSGPAVGMQGAWASPGVGVGVVPKSEVRGGKYSAGVRHDILKKTAVSMRARGHGADSIRGELLRRNNEDFNPPKTEAEGLSAEIESIINWVVANVEVSVPVVAVGERESSGEGGDEGSAHVEQEKKKPSPIQLAEWFLEDEQFKDKLKYINEQFYMWKDGVYKPCEYEQLESWVNLWLARTGREGMTGGEWVGKIIKCLRIGERYLPLGISLPAIVSDEVREAKGLIPFRNGILDMKEYLKTGKCDLMPHSPSFVSTYKLPFDFNPEAKCPTYDMVAAHTFGDQERNDLWDEIVGAHIYQPFPIEHFFMLQGEGSNGKSVLIGVLRALLGSENCSSVPLESFKPENFVFGMTYGKLANIISDQHDIENVNEGLLKQFVTREEMTFNRKHLNPIHGRPTAFLTICTNPLPRFADKSNGIWRRLILFSLSNTVPLEMQNPQLIEPAFWAGSGELSGVFNRAVRGLQRVIARGRLAKVDAVVKAVEEYRNELNPIAEFVETQLEFDPMATETGDAVYRAYRNYVIANGNKPMARITFSKILKNEIRRNYKDSAKLSDEPVRRGNYVGRVWAGLRLGKHVMPNDAEHSGLF